jgi:hypothetical protein
VSGAWLVFAGGVEDCELLWVEREVARGRQTAEPVGLAWVV